MYARYIPPPKNALVPKPAPVPELAPASKLIPAQPPSSKDSAFAYARWVPPAKSVSAPRQSTSQLVVEHYADDTPTKKRKRGEEEPSVSKGEKEDKAEESDTADDESEVDVKSKREKKKDKKSKVEDNEEAEAKSKSKKAKALKEDANGDLADTKSKKDKKKSKTKDEEKSAEGFTNENAMDVDPPAEESEPKEKRPKREKKKKQQDQGEEDVVESRHKSILEKKSKSLQISSEAPVEQPAEQEEEPAPTYALGPLPQPEPVLPDTSTPTYSTLPEWLSSPISVSQNTRVSFSSLGFPDAVATHLASKGYPDAFAVQTAAIPLLTPSAKTYPNDLLVAAATGSGKTLAYALPVVRDVSTSIVTRLRTLVVLPTRELATQAKEVFELCAAAWSEERGHKRVKIAVSIGSQVFSQDQDALVDRFMRYDPPARKKLRPAADSGLEDLQDSDGPEFDDLLPGHVWEYNSKVDVLICTPGRLVEHMAQTAGFSLDHVRWLIVDEADKLLAESYQGWINVVMPKLKSDNLLHARAFPNTNISGVRKVLLSATLTRDLGLLGPLQLWRPKLVVLQGEGAHAEHVLPEGLSEMAVRVKEASMKPLYLVELLEGGHLKVKSSPVSVDDSDETSDSSSDSSSSDSDPNSDSDSDTSGSDSDSDSNTLTISKKTYPTTALVFTKSNESSLRLARLLALLIPSLANGIQTLTSDTPTAMRRRILRSFSLRLTRVVVASDLVARGIDIAGLDHVINYDIPASVAAYVHRVGRTARAGRLGQAWTLVEDGESGWFWGKIGKGSLIKRATPFKRVKIGGEEGADAFDDETIKRYEEVLAQVGIEAQKGRKREKK